MPIVQSINVYPFSHIILSSITTNSTSIVTEGGVQFFGLFVEQEWVHLVRTTLLIMC